MQGGGGGCLESCVYGFAGLGVSWGGLQVFRDGAGEQQAPANV